MMLQRSTVSLARTQPSRRERVRATAHTDGPLSSLLRIFTPAWLLQTKDDFPENTGYTGTVSRARRPFKDGFSKGAAPARKAARAWSNKTVTQETAPEAQAGPLGYLNDAAERVVGHNFTGDATEPDWSATGNKGWKGDRPKKADGFHTLKL